MAQLLTGLVAQVTSTGGSRDWFQVHRITFEGRQAMSQDQSFKLKSILRLQLKNGNVRSFWKNGFLIKTVARGCYMNCCYGVSAEISSSKLLSATYAANKPTNRHHSDLRPPPTSWPSLLRPATCQIGFQGFK